MASAEAYITIARLVLSFEMELCNTTVEDLSIDHVRLVGYPKKAKYTANARGEIMVKITGRADGKP
jgi:hypothetical protein